VKAYDPESGVTLKFKTEKSADVGRLIAGLGRIGRQMAALPEKAEGTQALWWWTTVLYNAANDKAVPEEVAMDDAPAADGGAEAKDAPAPETKPAAPTTTGGSGGGKKKKKGKKWARNHSPFCVTDLDRRKLVWLLSKVLDSALSESGPLEGDGHSGSPTSEPSAEESRLFITLLQCYYCAELLYVHLSEEALGGSMQAVATRVTHTNG
jgi:hypothetical protein